jgi:hypothetical protein
MKKLYTILFLISAFSLSAQTTINYVQQTANYDAFFSDNGGNFDEGADQFGMWANGADPKQSVAWRTFTEDGTTTGTPSTMAIGDSFTITVSATQASYGVIGLALLSSPTSTATWDDRINNYAVQVNLNGNSGANDPWEVVSNGGNIDNSSIGGSTNYADFKFKFTLDTATTMTVSINDGTESFSVTLNNQNITGYSIYFKDDWNGSANANIYWKPTSEYTYAVSLNNKEFSAKNILSLYPNPTSSNFKLNYSISNLKIFDITGKLVKTYNGNFNKGFSFDISNLNQGIYLVQVKNDLKQSLTSKLIKL